jgi:hypothetical protein
MWFVENQSRKISRVGTGQPPAVTTSPSVVGSGVAGTSHSCSGASWATYAGQQPVVNPTHSADGYQWYRDGSPILGARAATYTPGADDLGHRLSCRLTVTYPLMNLTVSASSGPGPLTYALNHTPSVVPPPAKAAFQQIVLKIRQKGRTIRGALRLNYSGSRVEITARKASGSPRSKLGRQILKSMSAGRHTFRLRLNATGRRLLKRRGRVRIKVRIVVSAPGMARAASSRLVTLRRA